MSTRRTRIRTGARDSIIQSSKAGVAPRVGIQHIQVGRVNEIGAIYNNIGRRPGNRPPARWLLKGSAGLGLGKCESLS